MFNSAYKNLLVGHSHMEVAINDSLLKHTKNIAYQGESYFYTFFKLKIALEQNRNIKNVYIEFTNNQILKRMEMKVSGSKYLDRSLNFYMPFFLMNDYINLMKHSNGKLIPFLGRGLLKNSVRLIKNDYELNGKLGRYFFLDKTLKLDESSSHDKNITHEETFSVNAYKKSITYLYLNKIVNLCKAKNVNIVFVRSPLHTESSLRLFDKEFLEIKDSLFSKQKFIDNINFNLPNSFFADKEHLNYKGAIEYTKHFQKQIEFENYNSNKK